MVVLIPHVEVARRHVLPVVGVRIVGVVVVELGARIHAVASGERRGQACLVVDEPVPCGELGGREVRDHARAALLSLLVSPVGVVVAVVGQPVGLVCSGSLCGALGGVTPCDHRETVVVVDDLLGTEEVGE